MKITRRQLRRIIKEEIQKSLTEDDSQERSPRTGEITIVDKETGKEIGTLQKDREQPFIPDTSSVGWWESAKDVLRQIPSPAIPGAAPMWQLFNLFCQGRDLVTGGRDICDDSPLLPTKTSITYGDIEKALEQTGCSWSDPGTCVVDAVDFLMTGKIHKGTAEDIHTQSNGAG